MGTISLEHSDRLYWLGRYTERFFTTIKALSKQFDKMIGTAHSYTDYLDCFGLPDIYMDNTDFIHSLLFDESNCVRRSPQIRCHSCKWRKTRS